jgi:hypothetical protein
MKIRPNAEETLALLILSVFNSLAFVFHNEIIHLLYYYYRFV